MFSRFPGLLLHPDRNGVWRQRTCLPGAAMVRRDAPDRIKSSRTELARGGFSHRQAQGPATIQCAVRISRELSSHVSCKFSSHAFEKFVAEFQIAVAAGAQ